jgi:hypothetical protein
MIVRTLVHTGSQKTALAQFTDVLGWAAFSDDNNTGVQTLEDMALGNISHSFTAPLLAGVDVAGFKHGKLYGCFAFG